jgi:hypothetical protein
VKACCAFLLHKLDRSLTQLLSNPLVTLAKVPPHP